MSISETLLYPHDETSEFTGFNFQYGNEFGATLGIYDVSATTSPYYNSRSGFLPQKFSRAYIYAPPQGTNRHRAYPQFNYYTPANSATFFPVPASRLVVSFDVYVATELNDSLGEWFSLATFTSDYGQNWIDVITVNIDNTGSMDVTFKYTDIITSSTYYTYVGEFTESTSAFRKDQWNHLEIYLEYGVIQTSASSMLIYLNSLPMYWTSADYFVTLTSAGGSYDVTDAKIAEFPLARRQLLSATAIPGYFMTSVMIPSSATGTSQMHFGLYAHETVTSATCLNDNLIVTIPD